MNNSNLKIRYFDDHIREIEIPVSSITEFGVTVRQKRNSKGRFLGWRKNAYLISDGHRYVIGYYAYATEIKPLFKGKFTSEKQTYIEYKYSSRNIFVGERKATSWIHKIK